MKYSILAVICFALFSIPAYAGDQNINVANLINNVDKNQTRIPSQKDGLQIAVRCLLKDEQTSGTIKICYYDCLGLTAEITISSFSPCPPSINR